MVYEKDVTQETTLQKKQLTFAELVKTRRKALNLTQVNLGEKLGKKQSAIAMYENGSNLPEVLELFDLADVLDVHVNDVLDAIYYQRNNIIRKHKEVIIDLENLPSDDISRKYKFEHLGKEITEEEFKKMLKQVEFERFQKETEEGE